MTVTSTLDSLWQVVAVGLALGAGLPAVFALGLRLLYTGDTEASSESAPVGPARRIAAYACFTVIVAAVATGIAAIIITGQG